MKTLVIIGFLLIGVSAQAFSMGHPHNMFAARKQMRTKVASASCPKPKMSVSINNQRAVSVQLTKTAISQRLIAVLSNLNPLRSY
jgi:hypothetical protein